MTTAAETWTGDGFEVDVRQHPGVDVVAIRGDLDIATAGRLRELVLDAQRCREPGLVLDLTDVRFLDSTGIGAIVAAWRRRSVGDRRFGLACPPGPIRRVLDLVELGQVLDIWDSLDDALRALEHG